ncbi:LacI family DNA-binding transcriptional regulator [Streptomyces sp. GXMU-J15]|uniref:LacI family DNA-binding transcriptional regulator n=2 Tax=Streptomyces TaxID=1883 RepID=A0ABT7J1K6_9ACTN|nr:LacI family DNA-binding transcriptional regulator [Streptomyces sp. DI166]MDL2078222.1 LacI family DNA-binding transcriptional regulator [Streptomyces fuscus]
MAGRRPRQTATMSDVARIAGVSVSTVSHVLNRTRTVAPDTVRLVHDAVAACGYVPEKQARQQREEFGTIGLAMSAISNPYFADVVHGLDRRATKEGYSLLLAETHDDADTELRAVGELLRRRVSAIVLAPSGDAARTLSYARQAGIPVTVLDRFVREEVDQIGVENIESTARLVDHLAEIGHTRIAMISGRPGLATSEERVRGYRRGLERNNIPRRDEYLVPGDSQAPPAQHAVTKLLHLSRPPTALVVGNNQMTIGTMRGLRSAGIRVPDDIALVAFDDFEWSDLFQPRLTAIAQPTLMIGEQAFELALSRISHPDLPPRRVLIQPTFQHRDSCGCGSGEDGGSAR